MKNSAYNTTLTISLLLLFISSCSLLHAQAPTDALQAQCQTCITQTTNKIDCYKRWYQQTDSLMELYYNRLLASSDSAQKANLEDERQEWLMQRNSFFKKSYSSYNKNKHDEAIRIFTDNIAFVNQRVQKLAAAQSSNYSPANFVIAYNGVYNFDDQVSDDDRIFLLKADMKIKMVDNEKGWFRLFARMNVSDDYDGMLIDTLTIRNNNAIYQYYVAGGVCKIKFSFTRQGVHIKEVTENKNLDCVFGQALPLFGFYRKTSGRTPTQREMMKDRL